MNVRTPAIVATIRGRGPTELESNMSNGIPPLANVPGLAEMFFANVDATGDCWVWTGTLEKGSGYGRFGRRIERGAHRLVWRLLVGEIPDGYQIDHRCFNRPCVNPDHLEPVTALENCRRRRSHKNGRLTHCPKGHPYDDENTLLYRCGRKCKTCREEAARTRVPKPRVPRQPRIPKVKPPCSHPDCDRPSEKGGMCGTCYAREYKRANRDHLRELARMRLLASASCSEDDCERPAYARGLCGKHYAADWKIRSSKVRPLTL